MKRVFLPLSLVVAFAGVTWGETNQVKVTVFEATSTATVKTTHTQNTFKCNNQGCTGALPQAVAVPSTEVDIRATVNGENVLLTCDERRRKECLVLTAGVYDGELKGKSLWLISEEPLTHKQIKRRFKVSGSW